MPSRLALVALLGFVVVVARSITPSAKPDPAAEPELSISGPYTHENLSVFLLHGRDTGPARSILTLQKALEQNLVVVHETGSVNELAVENKSADAEVFIQSGDIVKGGRQDRLIAHDLLLPSKSGVVPVDSFCVEQGRWSGRHGEATSHFAGSATQAPKALKLAANDSKQQSEVWAKVAETQQKLSRNVGKQVNAAESPSSLQLALEDKDLTKKLAGFEQALANVLNDRHDVVGVAFAVNGKVEGAEVYGSPALFRKLWPKLLKSAATDAVAEARKDANTAVASANDVRVFLRESADGNSTRVAVASGVGRSDRNGTIARRGFLDVDGTINESTGTFMVGVGVVTDSGLVGRVILNGEERERQTGSNEEEHERQTGTQELENVRHRVRAHVTLMGRARMEQVTNQSEVLRSLPITDAFAARVPPSPQPPAEPQRLRVSQTTNDRGVIVESRDRARGGAIIHRSYIAK